MESHLLQMRGLKRIKIHPLILPIIVASFTDAWIETRSLTTWISISQKSHLLQMRGLKLL